MQNPDRSKLSSPLSGQQDSRRAASTRLVTIIAALHGKCFALLVPTDLDKQRHFGDIAHLAEVLGPRDRREMLALRPREKRRLISGLTRAQSGEDVNRQQAGLLARLALLLERSLD